MYEWQNIVLAAPLLGMKPVLLFEDEASFGRISEPSYCWVFGDERPVVPSVRVRQYRYVYGVVEPATGDFIYEIYEKCNTVNYNDYLLKVSQIYADSLILLVGDGAGWHTSKALELPENIRFFKLPPSTPEMNPTEQCWREIRTAGFKNTIFNTIKDVIDNFKQTVANIPKTVFQSIACRYWLPGLRS